MDSSARILVTGGTGFVGVNLIRNLLNRNPSIRATYHQRRPILMDERIEYLEADLTDPENCRAAVSGMDVVFMCAASTSGAAAIASKPLVHVTPNVVMNTRMLEASYLEGIRKFVWVSSSVGYPPSGDRPVKEEEFLQDDPPNVYFPSGWMKRYTEILGKMYSEKLERRMPVVVLRPSNIYGPYDKFDLQTSHVTAALIRKVVERQNPVVVWGDGNDVRDLIYIEDFIEAMLLAAEKIDTFNPLNIAKGKGYSVCEILRTILKIDGYENAKVVYDSSKPSMIPIRLIDTKKAQNLIGFHPRTELADGLRKTITWYRDNAHLAGERGGA